MASATSLFALLLLEAHEANAYTITATPTVSFGYVLDNTTSAGKSDIGSINSGTQILAFGAATAPFGPTTIQSLTTFQKSVAGTFTFSPSATGTATQTILVTGANGSPSNTATTTLTGTGVAPILSGPATSAIVPSYVLVNSTLSNAVTLTVSNVGNAYLLSPGTVNSLYNLNGSINSGNSVFTATAASIHLQDSHYGAGASTSQTYAYSFAPTNLGVNTASVTTAFTDGVGASGANVAGTITTALSGTGVAPVQSVANSTTVLARIGSGTVGNVNGTFAVSNIGDGNLAGTGVGTALTGSISTAVGTGFTASAATISLISSASSPASLGTTNSSTVGYTYTPASSRGVTTATVSINFTDGNSAGSNLPQSVTATLSGSAVGPTYASSLVGGNDTPGTHGTAGATVAPTGSISFGTVGRYASTTVYLTLANVTGDANGGIAALTNLTIDKYSISGGASADFSLSLVAGSVITEGGTLLVPITVTPGGTIGTLSSTLTIFTDESVGLAGTGDTFSYTLYAMSVPEPTSLAVLGAGLAGLASFRRRKRAAE